MGKNIKPQKNAMPDNGSNDIDITDPENIEKQLREQLFYAKALNTLAEIIITYEDSSEILEYTARIIGETLNVDLYSIYDIDFSSHSIKGISQWINLNTPGAAFTINNYSLDDFIDGSTYMLKSKKWLESHIDQYSIYALKDGSGELLHQQLQIKSCLWYPFAFRDQGYYCLVFSQTSRRRVWRSEEIDFIGTCAKLVEIALQKLENQRQIIFSQQAFYKAFNSSPAIMAMTSFPDGTFIDVNENFIKKTGLSPDEVIGRTYHEVINWVNDKDEIIKGFPSLNEGKMVANIKIKYFTKSGEKRYGLYSGDIIYLGGKPYCLSVINDITDLTKYEHEMNRLERLNLIGKMAASIGHEIRNPMTSVRGFLQIFRTKEEFAGYRDHLNLMIEELDRANAIITEYLSMARNKPTNKKMHNLNTIIDALHPLIQSNAARFSINLQLLLDKIPDLLLDEKEMRQLILNLSNNAMEAMPRDRTLTISTYNEDDEVVLAVKDEGPGINPEIYDNLGTPFLTTKDEGTGLGLAICYSICNRHQAAVDVQTGAGGTVFLIRFKAHN